MSASRYHHGDLRAALVRAGMVQVAARGEQSVALRELAREVGVSPTAAYRHFADREALVRTMAAEALGLLGRWLDGSGLESLQGLPRVKALGHAYLAWGLANAELFRLAFGPMGVGHSDGVLGAGPDGPRPQQHFATAAPGSTATTTWAMAHGVTTLAVQGTFGGERGAHAVLDQAFDDASAETWFA